MLRTLRVCLLLAACAELATARPAPAQPQPATSPRAAPVQSQSAAPPAPLSTGIVPPYEAAERGPANGVDTCVAAALAKAGIEPARPCSDEVFFRRVHIDMIGTLPDPQDLIRFLADDNPEKRAALIDRLLKRDEFADYWALKWCDALRVKAEFPINLWPNAVQAYQRWVRDAVRRNMPYDRFARELLTASGSNFRVGPANFYRAVQGREPAALADAVALTFMGTRLATWPEKQRADMTAFFSRIAYKPTAEWKEEIVCLDPAPADPLDAVLPDGAKVRIAPDQDPREVFADWLIQETNPWFAQNAVNRVWAHLVGRGIVNEPDDVRPDNPPSNPELLAYLAKELVTAHYDMRRIYRLILNSQTYQQSSIPRSADPRAEALFAFYPVRRIDAEVLIDALDYLSGTEESYTSPIPEPFTFIPESQRTIELADGSISSSFLEMFGRPSRDTGLFSERNNQMTDAQRLYLLNSSQIQNRIEKSGRFNRMIRTNAGNPGRLIGAVYANILTRFPTPSETAAAEAYFQSAGGRANLAAVADLAWALINSKEFLYRH